MDYSPLYKLPVPQQVKVPRILWNTKLRYHLHMRLLLVSVQSQINLVHAIPFYFRNINVIVILPSRVRSSKWLISLDVPHTKHLYTFSPPISIQYKAPSAFIPSSGYFPARSKYSVNISYNCQLSLPLSHRPQTNN